MPGAAFHSCHIRSRAARYGHRADRQIHALAAPVPERELAVEVFGIGWIAVAEPVPAFPNPVQVGVMEIEERVTADRGEVGHIAPECEMS